MPASTAQKQTLVTLPAHQLLNVRAHEHPDAPLARFGDTVHTFGDIDRRSAQVAGGLAEAGLGSGDRIALLGSYTVEMLDYVFGSFKVGAIVVPLNLYLRGPALEHQLADAGACAIVVDGPGLGAVSAQLAALPDLRTIIVIGDADVQLSRADVTVVRHDDVIGHEAAPIREASMRDDAVILYSSGTTGMPKGCVHTFQSLHRSGQVVVDSMSVVTSDIHLTAAPLNHALGFMKLISSLIAGSSLVVEAQFSASRFIPRAVETGATITLGVGFYGTAILGQGPQPTDRTHSLRVCAFAPMSIEAQDAFRERFGTNVFGEMYGQSECIPISFTPVTGDRKPGNHGKVLPDLEACALDDEGNVLPPGTLGEIAIRPLTPGVIFDRYWRKPEETLERIRGLWMHTGDLGRIDEDNYLTFVDRKNDFMRRRGENVSAFEVESTIMKHPAVEGVAVHAVAVEGEVDDAIKACILVAEDQELTPADIAHFLRNELPYFAIPQFVELVEDLPRTVTGRVMKYKLKEVGLTDATWDLKALGLWDMSRDQRRA
ncbi:AMP-binding protein [Rhodococcus koreensis]